MPPPPKSLVETRQPRTPQKEPANFPPRIDPPRGVLQALDNRGSAFFHQRLAPIPALQPYIQHLWFVTWDLRNQPPSLAETLPHPNCYLVFETGLKPADTKAEVAGVSTTKFTRRMEAWGQVFGLKFTPGGLRAFTPTSISKLTDRVLPAQKIFGPTILPLAATINALRNPTEMAHTATIFLEPLIPPSPDPNITLSTQLVHLILTDPAILTVESLATRSGYSIRSLQRLFRDYIGTTPKWVIRRYRLHELLERLHHPAMPNIAQLAAELGYADQAHLSHDFRRLSGYTPQQYRKHSRKIAQTPPHPQHPTPHADTTIE
ncbi:MAG: helix-turn-helix domain-containing protein [Acidobacteriaceae bacterium]